MRPANRPEKRLRGAAALAARCAAKGPTGYFGDALDVSHGPADSSRIAHAKSENGSDSRASSLDFPPRALVAALTVPGLVGRSRAIELLANAVLPLLAAAGPKERVRRAEAAYRQLPLPARYGAVRHLHDAVGGGGTEKSAVENREAAKPPAVVRNPVSDYRTRGEPPAGPGVRVDFRRQQGMLYLLKQYCTQGGCGRCPLS
jgi:hypothetical protein